MSESLGRLGHYTIVRRLGAGGMGEVFLGRDTRLERDVALKLLPAEFASDAQRVERFRREALTLAALNHPSIATLYAIEPAPGGSLALVMEFVPGETLAERIERGALPLEEALLVGIQIAEALEAAHSREVLHRDLKPANVTFAGPGRVKVLDFGLARRGAPSGPEAADAEGTPGYMSPEQAMGMAQDERTDAFGFGCVLFECLAGAPAFPGADPYARVAAAMHLEPDFAKLPARTPERVRALLTQLLAKDPEQRLASLQTARTELEEAAGVRRALARLRGEAEPEIPRHLPASLTRFVGRARELESAREALGRSRLLTLTGVGGCGKSRLALALAEQQIGDYPDGAWMIELAPLAEDARVAERIAQTLGVKEEVDKPLEEVIAAHLSTRRLLLVLDNCEHVLGTVASLVERWLDAAPDLRVLATSREGLAVAGEQLIAVPPLSAPSARDAVDIASLERFESVQLFVDRARSARPDFTLDPGQAPAVAEICRRLDGIPLAIELAASRIKVLSAAQIAERLDDRFRLLTGGSRTAMPRHQTLRATLQWSHDLLHEPERVLLRRLAVFAGGWTLEFAARVCDDNGDEFEVLDLLTHLVDKSLVTTTRVEAGAVRYGFLETVRQFAAERLEESGDAALVRDRHLTTFLELAEWTQVGLLGPDQLEHFARLDKEQENLLGAIAWCGHAEDGAQRGLRLAGALWRFWSAHGRYELGRRVLAEALARPGAEQDSVPRAHALVRAGGLAVYQCDYESARPLIEESLALYRRLGDSKGIARALTGLAVVATYQGDYATARACNEESLAGYVALNQPRGIGIGHHILGYLAWCERHPEDSLEHYAKALEQFEKVGDRISMAFAIAGLAAGNLMLGRLDLSRHQLAASLGLISELGAEREGAAALELVAELAEISGFPTEAAYFLGAARGLRTRLGSPPVPAEQLLQDELAQRLENALGAAAYAGVIREGIESPFPRSVAAALSLLERLEGLGSDRRPIS